mmetsp:Transcript_45360/g.117419  ORF Transcript_45360/g.117419 Transcript_45360/m.117419 type:complete len:142 (-) Transcript_45360:165-590(-)
MPPIFHFLTVRCRLQMMGAVLHFYVCRPALSFKKGFLADMDKKEPATASKQPFSFDSKLLLTSLSYESLKAKYNDGGEGFLFYTCFLAAPQAHAVVPLPFFPSFLSAFSHFSYFDVGELQFKLNGEEVSVKFGEDVFFQHN